MLARPCRIQNPVTSAVIEPRLTVAREVVERWPRETMGARTMLNSRSYELGGMCWIG